MCVRLLVQDVFPGVRMCVDTLNAVSQSACGTVSVYSTRKNTREAHQWRSAQPSDNP